MSFRLKNSNGPRGAIRIGADVGGTFTDVVVVDGQGNLFSQKVPSTPPHFERAVIAAIRDWLGSTGISGGRVREVSHGTTVATNAVLERRGARTALVTTKGFRDVLELRRIRVPVLYDWFFEKPGELVERYLRFEVDERILANGDVRTRLRQSELWALKKKLEQEAVESVAVCFLHAYAYPEHEMMAGRFLRKHLPHLTVSLSSEILPERREYERTATTVVNAYVRPVMHGYLGELRRSLRRMEIEAPLLIMQSGGGLTPEDDAASRPVFVLESGPAAGVLATAAAAGKMGLPNVIAFDMGGTTAKASMIEDGRLGYHSEYEVGASLSTGSRLMGGSGELIRVPSLDIAEVGAGGGSIAYPGSGRRAPCRTPKRRSCSGPGLLPSGWKGTDGYRCQRCLGLHPPRPAGQRGGPYRSGSCAASRSRPDCRPLGHRPFPGCRRHSPHRQYAHHEGPA